LYGCGPYIDQAGPHSSLD